MDEQHEKLTVPYIVHEGEMARNERHLKRIIMALVLVVVLLFASNALWLWAWLQYDYESSETTTSTTNESVNVDGTYGSAVYARANGSLINGKDHSTKDDNNKDGQKAQETP